MTKKRLVVVLVVGLLFIMGLGAAAMAAPVKDGFKVWSGTVAPFDNVSKPWNIKFNAPVLESDITGDYPQNIYITDVDNNVLPASLSLSADGRTVTLTPAHAYTAGSDYRLYISGNIHDRNGRKLSKAIVMPFKVSPAASSLEDNISISDSGDIDIKDKQEVLLTSPPTPSGVKGTKAVTDFEYNISYVAQVLPVTVDNVNVNGVSKTVTVQANDIFIDQNRAFVSYNCRGATYAGAVQIIDISDAEHPSVLNELKFNNMDINAVYYDSSSNQLLFGGGIEPGVLQSGRTSFVARIDLDHIQVSDIANSITGLPSNCVTSIGKKGNLYYVGTGAAGGGIIVLNSSMVQVNNRDVDDVRDIASYDDGFVALTARFPSDSDVPGKLITSLTDTSSDIIVEPFCSPEHKSTIDLYAGSEKILEDEDALVFMALADEGFRVVKMGGDDYCNQVVYSLPNPTMDSQNYDPDTVGVAYDGGLIFLANGDYGFQVLKVNGMAENPGTGEKYIDPGQFADLVGYHELTGSIYDGQYLRANNLDYKKRVVSEGRCSAEQNLLFVAVGDCGVNIYTLTKQNIDLCIDSFVFAGLNPACSGVIDDEAGTITVTVPAGTDLTALVPTIEISSGASISPASGVVQNFTNPVAYTLTGANGRTKTYTVTVTPQSSTGLNLDKIFAVGAGDDGKAIMISGSSFISGNTACNSTTDNSVYLTWSAKIKNGDLYIGPGGNPSQVVYLTAGQSINIPDGTIRNLPAVQNFSMPQFPDPPSLPSKGAFEANWSIPSGGFRISENGYYSSISVLSELTIDIGNQDRIIRTGSLSVTGNGKIHLNRTGNGRLILFIDDSLILTGSSEINSGGDYDSIAVYYSENNEVAVGGSTKLAGSLFAENASISIDGSGGITGHIITGGDMVRVTGNASANVRAIYAPESSLLLTGSGSVRGAVVAHDIKLEGNSSIYWDDDISMDFFNQLDWD